MAVATNGPPVLNGSQYVYPERTLAQLRNDLLIRLGYAAMLAYPPPGVPELLNSFLQDAHTQLYQRYPTLRQQRWYSITLQQGERHYDIPYEGAMVAGNDIAIVSGSPDTITTASGDFVAAGFTNGMQIRITGSDADDGLHTIATVAAGTLTLTSNAAVTGETAGDLIYVTQASGYYSLDPREVTYAGLLDGTIWNELICGIDPMQFNITQQSRPTRYEIREYVEVFPEPDKAYTLYLKGRTGLRSFTADDDVTSMDPHPVFLQALATAKAHYGQRDAQVYFQQLENLIGELNAGTYGTRRFVPNPQEHIPAMPYPSVTFDRT